MSSSSGTATAASGGQYISVADVKLELDPTSAMGTASDTLISGYIDQAQAWIEAVTFRRFQASTATRYYRQEQVAGKRLFLDDDLLTVTQLVNGNEGTVSSSNYWLQPRNDGPPYQWLELKSSEVWTFDTDGEIAVTGTWGYSATVNESIQRGMTRLVAWMYRSRTNSIGSNSATLFTADGAAVAPTSLPKEIGSFVQPFRRLTRLT
jgi:hypothetical protein